MTIRITTLVCIAATFALTRSAQSQTLEIRPLHGKSGCDTIEHVADGAMMTMYIAVKGAVLKPGVYHVATTTKLSDIIEYAGGLQPYARKSDIHILHDASIDKSMTEPEIVVDYAIYQQSNDPLRNPLLMANDEVVVPDMGSQNMER